jgi:hypothetical protein
MVSMFTTAILLKERKGVWKFCDSQEIDWALCSECLQIHKGIQVLGPELSVSRSYLTIHLPVGGGNCEYHMIWRV